MKHLYFFFFPLLIILINFLSGSKKIELRNIINVLFRSVFDLFGYVFFLYYLTMEHKVDTGGVIFAFSIYLPFLFILLVVIQLIYILKVVKKKE